MTDTSRYSLVQHAVFVFLIVLVSLVIGVLMKEEPAAIAARVVATTVIAYLLKLGFDAFVRARARRRNAAPRS